MSTIDDYSDDSRLMSEGIAVGTSDLTTHGRQRMHERTGQLLHDLEEKCLAEECDLAVTRYGKSYRVKISQIGPRRLLRQITTLGRSHDEAIDMALDRLNRGAWE